MVDVGKMISTIRRDRGISQMQLALKIKVTKQTISNYERGERVPDYETLEAIADALNVPVSMLISRDEQKKALDAIYDTYGDGAKRASHDAIRVPVLGTIPAGIPIEAIEDVIDHEEVPKDWGKGGKEYFALRVSGNSMSPEYLDGDVLILRKADTCDSGKDCAVMVNGNDAVFKRVRLTDKGMMLMPINPEYDPVFYSPEEVESLPVRIIGVVVEQRRKR